MTDKQLLDETKEAMEKAYDIGYDKACKEIIMALTLVPTQMISIEHVVKMIGIVQNISKNKK